MTPLLELLPPELNYANSPEMASIQRALTAAMGDVWAARDGFAAQLSPATATWGLPAWEAALALVPQDRADLDARRRAIIAKLRGAGVSTVERIRSVAEAQLGGEVWVTELAAEYRLEIWTRTTAVPEGGIRALTDLLKELMPAHLRWSYGVEYLLEPFVNAPDEFTLRRFVQSAAFDDRRSFPPILLDGSRRLDGSWLLDAAQKSMFGFPRFTISISMAGLRDTLEHSGIVYGSALPEAAGQMALPAFRVRTRTAENRTVFSFPRAKLSSTMEKNRQSLGRATITTDSMWRLDGSVPLDGSRRLNAEIRQEDI